MAGTSDVFISLQHQSWLRQALSIRLTVTPGLMCGDRAGLTAGAPFLSHVPSTAASITCTARSLLKSQTRNPYRSMA